MKMHAFYKEKDEVIVANKQSDNFASYQTLHHIPKQRIADHLCDPFDSKGEPLNDELRFERTSLLMYLPLLTNITVEDTKVNYVTLEFMNSYNIEFRVSEEFYDFLKEIAPFR